MSKTARRTWQLAESRLARFFGCERKVLSGSSGRPDDQSCSDATHPRLFLEGKLRESHTVRTLHDATRKLARKEEKLPVLGLFDKNRPGFLLVVHSDDWHQVVAEYLKAQTQNETAPESDPGPLRRVHLPTDPDAHSEGGA